MEIKFEEIRDQDLPEVKKIYDWYVANSTATFHTGPVSVDQLKEFLYTAHPVYKSYLIFAHTDIAGYCFLTYHKKRQAYDRTAEVTVYLKPEFCKKGIGQVALGWLEKKASGSGLKNLIGTISGDNEGSIALFQKAGFTKCAHFKNVGEKFGKVLDVVSFQKEI